MPPAPRNVAAMAQVQSVPRSIEFFEKLGFRVQGEFTPDGCCLMLAHT